MGISRKPFMYILEMFSMFGFSDDSRLCEIGDQTLRMDINRILHDSTKVARNLFEQVGLTSVSLDMKGFAGNTTCDLRNPIQDEYKKTFDIVLNIGTSEHVATDQYMVFKNVHDLCKQDGFMIHTVPITGSRKGHGLYTYSMDFFLNLVKNLKYKIIDHRITPLRYGARLDRDYIFCTFKKEKDIPFMSEKAWIDPDIDDEGFRRSNLTIKTYNDLVGNYTKEIPNEL